MNDELSLEACYRQFAALDQIARDFRELRPDDGAELLEKLRSGEEVPEDAEADFHDLVCDAIGNDAETIETYYTGGGEVGPFPVWIQTLAGVYWVRPLEGDLIGFYLSRVDAEGAAFGNWDYLTTDEDEDSLWE